MELNKAEIELCDNLTFKMILFFGNDVYKDTEVTEIAINKYGEFWFEKNGVWSKRQSNEITHNAVISFVKELATFTNKTYSGEVYKNITRNLLFSCALTTTKERIQVVAPPIVDDGCYSITIRKPNRNIFPYEQFKAVASRDLYLAKKSKKAELNKELIDSYINCNSFIDFLVLAVKHRKNIIVAGGTGSGKTTLMKSLMQEADYSDRIVTIEDAPELVFPKHENVVNMFYESEATKDGKLVTSQTLLKSCLRMKPDRILLAEIRGQEALDFLNIISSGHGGSITSIHSDDYKSSIKRLIGMALSHPDAINYPYEQIKSLVLDNVDVIVNLTNDRGERYINSIYFKDVDIKDYLAEDDISV